MRFFYRTRVIKNLQNYNFVLRGYFHIQNNNIYFKNFNLKKKRLSNYYRKNMAE